MRTLKRSPQYVMMLDLLMLVLFVFISNRQESQVSIMIKGNILPPETYVFIWDTKETIPNKRLQHFDHKLNKWVFSSGKVDISNSYFTSCSNDACLKFLPSNSLPIPKGEKKAYGFFGKTYKSIQPEFGITEF
jgi:hypothetical protein